MFKRMAVGLGALLALSLGALAPLTPAHAQGISQKVGVCDPKTVNNCLKPNSNGSINVSGTITASLGAFNPVGNATRAVTTTSANVALPTADPTVLVQNTGTSDAYIVMGVGSGTTATTAGTLIRAGSTYALNAGTATYLAAITPSGSTSLAITTGTGLPALAGAGGSGGSVPTGSAGSPNAAVVTVQGIASMTAIKVDGSGVTQPVSIAGTINVQAAASTFASGSFVDGAIATLGTKGDTATCATTNTLLACTRQLHTDLTSPIPTQAATVDIGAAGISQTTEGTTNAIVNKATTTNGATSGFTAALTTTVTAVKASGGNLYMLYCGNPNASAIYVQVFNVASGSVTLGTTTPAQSYYIGATASGGLAMSSVPIAFPTAISYAATTTATGSTAPGSAATCNVAYK